MCKIVILEPKRNTRYMKSSTLLSPPPQRRADTLLVERKVEEKVERKENDTKTPGAVTTPSPNNAERCSLKDMSKIKSSAHDVARNKIKSSKKAENRKSAQHIVPNAIRRFSVTPPPIKSHLPKNVRFLMDNKNNTENDSTDSEDSYTDPPTLTPRNIYLNSNQLRTPWDPSVSNEFQARYFPDMAKDIDSQESDTSSRIDAGEVVDGTFSPGWEETSETQSIPAQPIHPPATQSAHDGNATSNLLNQTGHNIAGGTGQAIADISTKFNLDQSWDSDSDEASATDCSEVDFHIQAMNSNHADRDCAQDQGTHVDDGFYDWLEKLNSFSPQSTFSEESFEPFMTHHHREEEPVMGQIDPTFKNKQSSSSGWLNLDAWNDTNADFQVPDMMNNAAEIHGSRKHKGGHAAMPSSYNLPSSGDIEEPTRYNPGLGIYWRDV